MAGNCTGPTPITCANGTCGATQADCASSGNIPAPQGSNPPPSTNIDNPCQRFCASSDIGCRTQRAIDCGVHNAIPAPIRDAGDFLNRLWNRGLGNPSFWKFTGLIGAGVLAVIIGGIIFVKE